MIEQPDWRHQIIDACRRIAHLDPYDAALLYRDVVRLEAPQVLQAIDDAGVRGKYTTYLKRFTRPAPGRYFTDYHYAKKLVPTLELIRSGAVATVLDAACGNGFEAVLFALQGKKVFANDISAARAEIAEVRRRLYSDLLGRDFDLTVTCGNAIEMSEPAPRFDVVYVQEAISHIHPAEAFLRETASRLLTPTGRLVVCDSNSWNPVIRFRISRQLWNERRTLRHYVAEQIEPLTGRRYVMAEERLFSPLGIARAFRSAGLEVERLLMSGFVPPQFIKTPSPTLARRIDDTMSRVPVLKTFGGFYTAIGHVRSGSYAGK